MKEKLVGNLLYGQGGGPTSVINASAYGLFKEAFKHLEIENIYTANYGLLGILNDDLFKIENTKELEKLKATPGAAFGSSRIKLDLINEEDKFEKILEVFKKHNIRYFFYNGGNDSMDTTNKIGKYLKEHHYECNCIGINKTIDNDLEGTDFSLGYATSAVFIANCIIQVALDDLSYEKGRVNIIEVMGRDTGWLAASAKLAKIKGLEPDLIYVPETNLSFDKIFDDIKKVYEKKKRCIVVVSEGIKNEDGEFLFTADSTVDKFGHLQLGGIASTLASLISKELGVKTRYIELSLLQRASTITPNLLETKIAIKMSQFALRQALKGCSNKVVVIKRLSNEPYKYKFALVDSSMVANNIRLLPLNYINSEKNNITDEFLKYLLPLVENDKYLLDFYKKD